VSAEHATANRRPIDIGLEHHQAGRIAEAAAIYRDLIDANPEDHDALHLLGVTAIQGGRFEEAVELISRSLAVDSSNPHALNHLGEAYRGLQFLDEAMTCFERALELNSQLFQAHNNLGNVFQARGNIEAAVACYKNAVDANPQYAEAHTNLGNILLERASYDAAITCYRRALEIRPEFAEASYNLGNVFKVLRNYDEAIPLYRKTVSLKPDFVDGYLALARAYQENGEREQALTYFQRAAKLAPENPEPQWGWTMSQIALVAHSAEAVVEHRAAFDAGLAALDQWFNAEHTATGFNALGTQQAFYLAYQEENNRDLLARYGSLCGRLAKHWQDAQRLAPRNRTRGKKIRVGLASAHVCNHSVWNALTKGWVEHLDERRFELHVFSLGGGNDVETGIARSRSAGFVQGLAKSHHWAAEIIDRSLDILIYPEIGMDPMTAKLAGLRLAPVQATTWGHPETSGLPSMDYYISAENFEPDGAQDYYTEKLVLLPHLSCFYQAEQAKREEVALDQMGVDANQPLFVCPGTPFKYAPQHDWVYPAIAKRLRRCQFLFFKYPTENLTHLMMQRMERAFADVGLHAQDFIIQLPWLKKESFFGLMHQADAFLDTIGFSGFNSAIQAIECGLPVVTREGRFLRGRLASGVLRRMGITETIGETDSDYVNLAVRLGSDSKYRIKVRDHIKLSRGYLYDDLAPIHALQEFLMRSARSHLAS
jgi:protein O-GlcNAc transferase